MAKEQVNFRMEKELLGDIKRVAKEANISYTQWITEACQQRLGVAVIEQQLEPSEATKLAEAIAQLTDRVTELEKKPEATAA